MSKKIIIAILAVSFLIFVGFYFIYQKYYFSPVTGNNIEQQTEKSIEISKPELDTKVEVKNTVPALMSGYKLFKNTEFGFEIQYPVSWTVNEEINENVRGEMVKEYYFKKPTSDLRFAILPRDGLSYGVGAKGTSTAVFIGGSQGMQTQYILKDGRRLWLLFPQYGLYNWLEDLGRLDIMTSSDNPTNDTQIFEKMLNSFKLLNF